MKTQREMLEMLEELLSVTEPMRESNRKDWDRISAETADLREEIDANSRPQLFCQIGAENKWTPCPDGIRIALDVHVPGEDVKGELVFNFTSEGLICDIWTKEEEGSNAGTSSELYDDIVSRLVEDNS